MMDELEPGHPRELVSTLRNWLREAESPIGSFPAGIDPVEWAIRQFIDSWQGPVRASIREIEDCLGCALQACEAGRTSDAIREIDMARQLIGEDLRDDLGLYPWDEESERGG
jgi:hypothetical protein